MSADDKAAAAWGDYVSQQKQKKIEELERQLNAANRRISWLEEAVQDSINACERDIGILEQRMNNLKTAKEAKP